MLLLQMAKQIDNLRLNGDVQRGDRLIRNEQLRLHGQGARNGDALALPAGKLTGVFVQIARVQTNIAHLEFRLGAVAAARRADVLDAHRLCNDIAHTHAPVQARAGVLKDDLPLCLQRAAVRAEGAAVTDVDAAIQDLPALRPQQVHHAARDGRFAGAGFADETENLAAPERERDVVHSAEHGPSPEREGVRQTAHLEKRLSHGARLRSAA